MLDPRIYRTGLVVVALAVIVVAFSLHDQPGSLGSTLAPDAFSGQNAYATMTRLAAQHPNRRPGSRDDEAIASRVAGAFRSDGFSVSRDSFDARTVEGTRRLENVVGVRPGLRHGSIVVVAHRDALLSPAAADASGTAALLELARVLSGETLHRTIVLASTSGSTGAAGDVQLARQLGGPVDAVLVLGDLAGTRAREPLVEPWSNRDALAPPALFNTVAGALNAQAGLTSRPLGVDEQFLRLAAPMTASEQWPFEARGTPAVQLSLSGDRTPAADEPVSPERITALGRTVLQTVTALDAGPSVPAPSGLLLYQGKVIPLWAIRLLVLALILPVLAVTLDGVARVRRRGHPVFRLLMWFGAPALPFALVAFTAVLLRASGVIDGAPPGPVGPAPFTLRGGLIAALFLLACSFALGLAVMRLTGRGARAHQTEQELRPGAAPAILLMLCAVSLGLWVLNPFTAGLTVPALHLWIWVVEPEARIRPAVSGALLVAGLAAPALVVLYCARTLGLGPAQAVWNGILMLAGGDVGFGSALAWSLFAGCAVSAAMIALRTTQNARRQLQVTVRGPVSYAGPGSLGGTESALRR